MLRENVKPGLIDKHFSILRLIRHLKLIIRTLIHVLAWIRVYLKCQWGSRITYKRPI